MNKLKKTYRRIRRAKNYIDRRQISMVAAATAFWVFLSLVPIVILFVSVLPYTSVTQEQVLNLLRVFFPDAFDSLVYTILEDIYDRSLAVLSVSIVATLWSSAMGYSNLFRGLESIQGNLAGSNYFLRRFRGILYTVGMILAIVLSVVVVGFGQRITDAVTMHFPPLGNVFRYLLRFRMITVMLVLTVFFLVIYRWSTEEKSRFRELLPGALFSTVGWYVLTGVFTLWINNGHYGTYGSLATVVAVMLWLYYCQYIILLGACLNRALQNKGLDD